MVQPITQSVIAYSRVEEVVTTLHSCTITRQDYDRPKFKTEGHTETNRNHVRT